MPASAKYRQVSAGDLEKILADPGSELFKQVWEDSASEEMALVNACEALFFLLTGHHNTDGSPFAMAVFGSCLWRPGEGYFDREDGIYYGNGYLTSAGVQEVANALRQTSEDDLLQRFLQNDFEAAWGQPEDIIMPYYRELTSFYSEASTNGSAVLVEIT